MIEHGGELSLARQCALLGVSRSSQYYAPSGESAENLALMRRMDELHLAHPFYGSRQMARHLRREGVVAGRHRIRRLRGLMGLEAVYCRPRTSAPNPAHRVYPYLLRDLTIDRPDQVWCADITYIPVSDGFFYLVAVMDWASRHVLSWRLSNTMDSAFCIEALDAALRLGVPEIFNTDQGSQFTSVAFTARASRTWASMRRRVRSNRSALRSGRRRSSARIHSSWTACDHFARNRSDTASSSSRSRSGAGYRTEASRKATVTGNGQ